MNQEEQNVSATSELDTVAPGGEVANLNELEERLAAQKQEQLRDERIQIPRLDVVQGTTKRPPEGANPGDFFNTITGDVFGTSVLFLTAVYHRGRAYAETEDDGKGGRRRTGKFFAAGPEATVPSFWPEQFRGKAFAELPEAEERYSEMANAEVIAWGSGPPIQTTYNFTGLVLAPELDGVQPMPMRLSLKSTSAGAARKLLSMLKPLRTYWARPVLMSTERRSFDSGPAFVVNTGEYGSPPEDNHRLAAVEIALAAERVGFVEAGSNAISTAADAEATATEESDAEPADRGEDKPKF